MHLAMYIHTVIYAYTLFAVTGSLPFPCGTRIQQSMCTYICTNTYLHLISHTEWSSCKDTKLSFLA